MDPEFAQVAPPVELPAMHHDNDNSKNSCRAPQSIDDRQALAVEYDDALAILGQIEADAGPTLRRDLLRSKRVQAAFISGAERKGMTSRCLGQRAALVRLMKLELGIDPVNTDRARLYVDHMLKASANVSAITGSGWPSHRGWLWSRLPALMDAIGPEIETDFVAYFAEAKAELAGRIPSGDSNLHTGPTPAEIAEALSITDDQLRQARANRCGLTSIAPRDHLTRDRERKEVGRRKAGMKPQSERTTVADMKALAERMGCSLSTIQRKRRDGTLDAFIATRARADQNLSSVKRDINDGHFLVTAPMPPDNDSWREYFAYLGEIVGLFHEDLAQLQDQYPGLDLSAILPALDAEIAAMTDVEPPGADAVLRELLERRYGQGAFAA